MKLAYSRDNKIVLDSVWMECKITSSESSIMIMPPSFGVFVYGLYMEGGRFDRNLMCLQESLPRQVLDPMPCVWLKPIIASEYNPVSVYDCPLYRTSARAGTLSSSGHSTNYVLSIPGPCESEGDQAHWLRRGCAMLCMNDE